MEKNRAYIGIAVMDVMGVGDSFRGIEGASLLFLGEQSAKCSLVGNTYGIVLQCLLGVVALAFLVGKRYLEPSKTRRSWGVWAADASKQAIGAGVAHGMNMLLAARFAAGAESECLFYLVHFLTDAVFGLIINILLLMVLNAVAETGFYPQIFRFGDYGYVFSWPVWFSQLSLWLSIVCLSKAIVVLAVVLPLRNPLYALVDRVFSPLAPYPRTELFLVMVAIPLVFNAASYWVQDSFLMDPAPAAAAAAATTANGGLGEIEEEDEEGSAKGGGMWAKDNFYDGGVSDRKSKGGGGVSEVEVEAALASLLNKHPSYFSELAPSSSFSSSSPSSYAAPVEAEAPAPAAAEGNGYSYPHGYSGYRSRSEQARVSADAAALREAAAIASLSAAAAQTSGQRQYGAGMAPLGRAPGGVDVEKVLEEHHRELAFAGPI